MGILKLLFYIGARVISQQSGASSPPCSTASARIVNIAYSLATSTPDASINVVVPDQACSATVVFDGYGKKLR